MTWWKTLLDGLVGGVLGGLVTAWAVLATLRHERRQLDRSLAVQLRAKLLRTMVELRRDLEAMVDLLTTYDRVRTVIGEAERLQADAALMAMEARDAWPEYALQVEFVADWLEGLIFESRDGPPRKDETEVEAEEAARLHAEAVQAFSRLLALVEAWLFDPNLAERTIRDGETSLSHMVGGPPKNPPDWVFELHDGPASTWQRITRYRPWRR